MTSMKLSHCLVIVALLVSTGCTDRISGTDDTSSGELDCEPGELVTQNGVEHCLFHPAIIEDGFRCPLGANFQSRSDFFIICSEDDIDPEELGDVTMDREWEANPSSPSAKLDLLFVVDNSNSMCEEQEALVAHFWELLTPLIANNYDFRVAVVTTDMSTDPGTFRDQPGPVGPDCAEPAPACSADGTGPVLRATDYALASTREDEQARLIEDFSCIGRPGTVSGAAGFERGLDSMMTALGPDMLSGVNAGFRRDDAWLGLVFLTDENDCSHGGNLVLTQNAECEWLRDDMLPIDAFVDFVKTEVPGTQNGERVVAVSIAGPDDAIRADRPAEPSPSCSNPETGTAYSGYRYHDFTNAFDGLTMNICSELSAAEEAGQFIADQISGQTSL